MILQLVSDNTQPKSSLAYADQLRVLADRIEAGEFEDVSRIALAIEFDGGLSIEAFGESCDPHAMMGLFEAAKLMTFAEAMDD